MNPAARDWLVRRSLQAAPFEACGFILETGEAVEIRNISLAPMRAFKMDYRDAFEKLKGTTAFITGIWHTHPRGHNEPSATDLDGIKMGAIQRNWDYFIVTAAGVFQYETGLYAPQDHAFWEQFHRDATIS